MKNNIIIYPVIFALFLVAGSAHAEKFRSSPYHNNIQNAHQNNLGQVVSETEQRTGGRVLSADIIQQDGQKKYRIKLLTPSGHVRILRENAR